MTVGFDKFGQSCYLLNSSSSLGSHCPRNLQKWANIFVSWIYTSVSAGFTWYSAYLLIKKSKCKRRLVHFIKSKGLNSAMTEMIRERIISSSFISPDQYSCLISSESDGNWRISLTYQKVTVNFASSRAIILHWLTLLGKKMPVSHLHFLMHMYAKYQVIQMETEGAV